MNQEIQTKEYLDKVKILFGGYDKMGDAFRVTQQYIGELTAQGQAASALSAIRSCNSTEVLQDRLFYLTQTGFQADDKEKTVSRRENNELQLSWFEQAYKSQEDSRVN